MADLATALVADALDQLGLRDQTLPADIRPLGPGRVLVGHALPIRVVATTAMPDPPYVREMAAVEAIAPGEVPVYACDADVAAAIFGELFGVAARARGAAGVVCHGPIRDARALATADWPVFASARSPLDTRGRAEVTTIGEPVRCGGVAIARGDLIVADDDGAIVVPAAHEEAVRAAVSGKRTIEDHARADLAAAVPLTEVWERWGAL